jgi:putative NIF3 family GTP cyclohydrolase 1 type 2
LPLDAHPTVGNNIQLAQRFGIKNLEPIGDTLVWQGEVDTTLSQLSNTIEQALNRVPLVFGGHDKPLKRIAWCTGGAQSYIEHAININADCFITGEVSEQIPAIAKENDIAFISAGHHATERYGIQALCQHLSDKFNIKHQFIDVDILAKLRYRQLARDFLHQNAVQVGYCYPLLDEHQVASDRRIS